MFDEYGALCGLVCDSFEGSHESGEPISYVTTLWPLFALIVDSDRGDHYPQGVRYPAIELARDGQIHISDRLRLLRWFKTHVDRIRISLRSVRVDEERSSVAWCSLRALSPLATPSASFSVRAASDHRLLGGSVS